MIYFLQSLLNILHIENLLLQNTAVKFTLILNEFKTLKFFSLKIKQFLLNSYTRSQQQ